MDLRSSTEWVLFLAGLIFLLALLLGVWKYRQMARAPDGLAHPYVDTAHRAALLYSFATLLLAAFVETSGWSEAVNLTAALAVIAFFLAAIAGYAYHGFRRDTTNQFVDPVRGTHGFMWALIVVEIGGVLVLLAGFADARLL
jgi:DMSO/TMAO reductase YedYZ heme-binding membrane subunit